MTENILKGGEIKMTFIQKIGTGIATASIVATAFSPLAFAQGDVEVLVNGNGADSSSTVEVSNSNKVEVGQSSVTVVGTSVYNVASTGNNSINKTTGEDGVVSIDTGKATATTNVSVTGGSNVAHVPSCGCENDTTVEVKNNGADSKQTVKVKNSSALKVGQATVTEVLTEVMNKAKTGMNKISKTTGNSKNKVVTGNAVSETKVEVESGSNMFGPHL